MLYDIGYVLCGISTKAKTLLDFGEYECICISIVEVELKLQRATKSLGLNRMAIHKELNVTM